MSLSHGCHRQMEENQFFTDCSHIGAFQTTRSFAVPLPSRSDDPDSLVRQGTELLRHYPCADGFHFQVPVGDFASSLARTTEDLAVSTNRRASVVGGDHGVRGGPAPGPKGSETGNARRRGAHRARGGEGRRRRRAGALPVHGSLRGDAAAHRAARGVRLLHHRAGRPAREHARLLEVPPAQVAAGGLAERRAFRGVRPRRFALPKVQRRRQEAPSQVARVGRPRTARPGLRGRSAPDGVRGDAGSVAGATVARAGPNRGSLDERPPPVGVPRVRRSVSRRRRRRRRCRAEP